MFTIQNPKYKKVEDTPAYRIFNWYFEVTIPNIYLRDLEDLETNGVYTTGDDELDELVAGQTTTTMRTIAELAELYDAGCAPILSYRQRDSVRIKEVVVAHLEDWSNHLKGGSQFIRQDESDERMVEVMGDLAKLEELAKHYHTTGIAVIKKKSEVGGLLGELMGLGGGTTAVNTDFQVERQQDGPVKGDFGRIDVLADIIESPTVLGRIRKWQR